MAKELGGLFGTNADAPLDGQVPVWHTVPGSDPNAGLGFWVPTTSGGGSGDVVGPAASVDGEIALYDGITGKLLKRATGTGIVRVTSGVYGTPGNVVESEITLADNTTNDVSNTKHGFAPKNPNDATKYLDGTGAYTVPAGTGINQLTGDVTAGPGSGSQVATLANSGVSAGTVGDATHVAQTTVDAKGRVTALVSVPITAGGIGANVTTTSAFASPPSSPTTGDVWFPNNSFYLERYSGSAQVPWGPIFPCTPPVDGDFTWTNQGGASVDTTNGAIYLLAPAGASASWRIRKKNAPSTPYTITIMMLPCVGSGPGGRAGLFFRQASDGKLVGLEWDTVNGYGAITVENWTSETVFSSTVVTRFGPGIQGPVFFRIGDDGTNRKQWMSPDGQHWILLNSVGRTNFMTATEVGFACSEQGNLRDAAMTLLSWKEA